MANRSRNGWVGSLALAAGAVLLLMPGCGGSSKLEFYSNEPGNFRVLVAGKPGHSSQTLTAPAGQLSMTRMESVDGNGIRRVVVYTDIPLPIVQASDPTALLDGGIRGMSGKAQWAVQRQGEITLDGHPGRDVRFAINAPTSSEKGAGTARIFLVGNRLYQAIMVGPTSKVNEEELDHFVKSFELLKKVALPAIATVAPLAQAAGTGSPIVVAQARAAGRATGPGCGYRRRHRPRLRTTRRLPTHLRIRLRLPPHRRGRLGLRLPVRIARHPRRRARATRSRQAPARAPAENRAAQARNEGPDPSKPAEVAIEASAPAGAPVERPAPNGREQERFREVAPERGVLVGVRVGYDNAQSLEGGVDPAHLPGR